MRGIGLLAVLVAALSSCDPDAARAVEFCSVFCECEPPAGLSEDQCVVQCTSELGPQIDEVPQACLSCISENRDRCLTIEVVCDDACDQGIDEEPPDPTPEPPVFVDAGVDAF